ncbi:hypothetical protein VTK26DRAFT_1973 [Humicola hyalothermophila]
MMASHGVPEPAERSGFTSDSLQFRLCFEHDTDGDIADPVLSGNRGESILLSVHVRLSPDKQASVKDEGAAPSDGLSKAKYLTHTLEIRSWMDRAALPYLINSPTARQTTIANATSRLMMFCVAPSFRNSPSLSTHQWHSQDPEVSAHCPPFRYSIGAPPGDPTTYAVSCILHPLVCDSNDPHERETC